MNGTTPLTALGTVVNDYVIIQTDNDDVLNLYFLSRWVQKTPVQKGQNYSTAC